MRNCLEQITCDISSERMTHTAGRMGRYIQHGTNKTAADKANVWC